MAEHDRAYEEETLSQSDFEEAFNKEYEEVYYENEMTEFDKDTNVRSNEYINMSDLEIIYCRKGCAECKNEMCLDEMLRGLPTIDIVHCYECRWLNDKGKANCFIREKTGICRTTFFCADGERRKDG